MGRDTSASHSPSPPILRYSYSIQSINRSIEQDKAGLTCASKCDLASSAIRLPPERLRYAPAETHPHCSTPFHARSLPRTSLPRLVTLSVSSGHNPPQAVVHQMWLGVTYFSLRPFGGGLLLRPGPLLVRLIRRAPPCRPHSPVPSNTRLPC